MSSTPRTLRRAGALVVAGVTSLAADAALARPRAGAPAPDVRLEDAEGRAVQLQAFHGKPILIVYEDRDSSQQNQVLKDELAKLAAGDRYKSGIALAAVADVSEYDFWPARGFVKDAIREESRKQGTTIYCDWTGRLRDALQLKRGVSNVVLVGKRGQVLFAADGPLPTEDRKRLIALLRTEVEG